jgi:phospholipase C
MSHFVHDVLAAVGAGIVLLGLAASSTPSSGAVTSGMPRIGNHRIAAWRGSAGRYFPRVQAVSPIRHVVVLYLENHSFDSLLGFWCDQNPGRCPDGGMPSSVRLSNGAVVKPFGDPNVVPLVKHDYQSQLAAINGGAMNGWQNIPGCHAPSYTCVSGYEPSQVPNLIRLVTRFAISDHTFSLDDSPSWGGHLYPVMASLDGFMGDTPQHRPGSPKGPGWGCNSGRSAQWARSPGAPWRQVPACVPDPSLPIANGGAWAPTPVPWAPTIMDRLDAAGLSWRIYGASAGEPGYFWSICPSLADCLYTSQAQHIVPDRQFRNDAHRGRLPAFSIITPGGGAFYDSEHNGVSITAGDNWLGTIAAAVMNGPQWSSTVLFITWDDCGCFYDQALPPVNPDGTQQGLRTPLVIVSPYAKPGYTDTTATTFAGILAYTEDTFGLRALGANDAAAYPFTKAFNYAQAPAKPERMVHRSLPASAKHIHLSPALENDPT